MKPALAILGNLHLAAPAWVWAIPLALALPVLLHLLTRRLGRPAVLPTAHLLARSVRGRRPALQLRQLLLMLFRGLILALLALAASRPLWSGSVDAQHGAEPSGEGPHIFILDHTASMSRRQGGGTLHERAVQQIQAALSRLDSSRDRAAVILLQQQPAALLPRCSNHFAQLSALLAQLPPSQSAGELDPALQLALALAADQQGPPRIELFSDLQQSSFPAPAALPAGASFHVHPLSGSLFNLGLSRPRLQPAQPIAGETCLASVDLTVSLPPDGPDSPAPPQIVTVRLSLGDFTQDQQVVIAESGRTTVAFSFAPPASPAEVALPLRFTLAGNSDALPLDDQTQTRCTIRAARTVLLASRGEPADPSTSTFYLLRALAPATTAGVHVQLCRPEELPEQLARRQPDALFLIEAGAVPQPAGQAVVDYVDAGGAAVWIIDSPGSANSLAALGPSSPLQLNDAAPAASRASEGADLLLASEDPIFAAFTGSALAGLAHLRFSRRFPGALAPAATALLHHPDGTPLLAARWLGAGRLAVLAADLAPAAGDAVKQPVFVALMHQLLRELCPGPSTPANAHPGDTWPLARGQMAPVVGRYPPEDSAGPSTPPATSWTYVELDPRESALQPLPAAALATITAPAAPFPARRDDPAPTTDPAGLPLWPYLLATGLLLLVIEPLWLRRLDRGEP